MIRSSLGIVLRLGRRRQAELSIRQLQNNYRLLSSAGGEKPSLPPSSSSEVAPVSEDNLPAKLIDFQVAAKIEGEESHIATVELKPGETLRAEAGAMLFMTHGVELDTNLSGASNAFSRMMTGQNMFLTDFKYTGSEGTVGTVGLGTDFPSKILRFSLADFEGRSLICQRGAYLASNPTVNIEMEFTKTLTSGFFGGQGFILQRLTGEGDVLVKGGGTIVCKELEEGQSLRVTSGSIVAFEPTVNYDVQMLKGVKNVMFGGEGLFVTELKGPGRVWLQGMPADRMIAEIASRVPSGGPGIGIPIGGGGGGAADEAADGGAEGDSPVEGGGEEAVASSDAAVEADRQATVASSGAGAGAMAADDVDADSQSALFGDAVENDGNNTSTTQGEGATNAEDDFSWSSSSNEPTFEDNGDDAFSAGEPEEPTFDDGGFEEDSTTFESTEDAAQEASEGAGGLLSTLWDFFMSDDE